MYLVPLTVVPLGYEQWPKEQPMINTSPFTRHVPGIADLAVYERMPNHRGRKSVEHPNIIPQGQRAQVTGSGQRPKYSQTSGMITERTRRNNHALGHFNFLYTHIQTRSWPTWLQLTSHWCHTIGQGMWRHLLSSCTARFLPHTLIHYALVVDQTLQLLESWKWSTHTEQILHIRTLLTVSQYRNVSCKKVFQKDVRYLKCNTLYNVLESRVALSK